MFVWIALIFIVWLVLFRPAVTGGNAKYSMRDFNKLVKKIKTDENKGQIDQLIKFHNQRVKAGADGPESLERMIRDLKRLGGMEEEELF